MRIVCCGSRDWGDAAAVMATLVARVEEYGTDITIVHGAARGADRIAANCAVQLGLEVEAHPARWDTEGKAAGYKRNNRMLAAGADLVLAFKDGFDRTLRFGGTEHMVRIAKAQGIPVRLISHQTREEEA